MNTLSYNDNLKILRDNLSEPKVLLPSFQRRGGRRPGWSRPRSSRLILSFLTRILMPIAIPTSLSRDESVAATEAFEDTGHWNARVKAGTIISVNIDETKKVRVKT